MDLREYIETHPPQGFRPVPHYFRDGDFISWYWKDDLAYSDPVHVDGVWVGCLERSIETNEVVGVKIFGVAQKVEDERRGPADPAECRDAHKPADKGDPAGGESGVRQDFLSEFDPVKSFLSGFWES